MVWNVLLFDLILVVQSSQSSILTLSPNFSYHHHPHLHSHHHPHPHPPHHYQNYNHNWTRPNDISLSSSISADASSTTQFQFQAIAQPLIKAAAAAIDPNSELRLFNFNWDSVKKYLIITTFLLIAIVIKILHANIRLFHTYLPESW